MNCTLFPRFRLSWLAVALLALAIPSVGWCSSGAALLLPANYSTGIAGNATFEWTSVEGAEKYYLYVGTSAGSKDVVNSGEITTTGYSGAVLPGGVALYARLWTFVEGRWQYADSTFTTSSLAYLSTPAVGTTNIDPRVAFSWSSVVGVDKYYLYVGTSIGAKDVVDSGEMTSTSYGRVTLPGGVTLYARLWTRANGRWLFTDSSFSTREVVYLTSPADGATNVDTITTLRWSKLSGAQAYFLYVGTTVGGKDVVSTGELAATEFSASSLPAARSLYARIWVKVDGKWTYRDSQFSTSTLVRFTNVRDGQDKLDLAVPLQWAALPDGAIYTVYAGSSPGAYDLLRSGELTTTSWSVRSLPGGRLIYFRLWSKWNGAWRYVDVSATTLPRALLLQPVAGSMTFDPSKPFTWSVVDEVEAYYLYVGSSPGASDLVNSGTTLQTSSAITSLPAGKSVYARLWTRAGAAWRYEDTAFTTRQVAWPFVSRDSKGTTPVDGTITWHPVEGADRYYVYIGRAAGTKDLVNSGELTTNQLSYSNLPGDATLYVRLWTRAGGQWRYVDATIRTQPVVSLTNLTASATDVPTQGFVLQWDSVTNATAYYVYVGSSRGAKDIADSNSLSSGVTSYALPELSPAVSIYIRVFAQVEGVWYWRDVAVSTEARSRLTYPANGAADIDLLELKLTWYPVPLASEYSLAIGSAPGKADLVALTGLTAATVALPDLPGGVPLYVRLGTRVGQSWLYADSSFVGQPVPLFTYPRRYQIGVDRFRAFEWTAVGNAEAYRLTVGTTAGGTDILDTGPISDRSAPVPNLPSTGTVFARIAALVHGAWANFDIAVRMDDALLSPTIVMPSGSYSTVDPRQPLSWIADPVATEFRVSVGTANGLSDVLLVESTRTAFRLVDDLPRGIPLYVEVAARYADGRSVSASTIIVIAAGLISFDERFAVAKRVAAEVRGMADANNMVRAVGNLRDVIRREGKVVANCASYTAALIAAMNDANTGLEARSTTACLNPNTFDCHTLVEVLDPARGIWVVLDPTFGLIIKRTSDGSLATIHDLSMAVRGSRWGDITYEFLTSLGGFYVRNYYLDYPLLFVNVYLPNSQAFIDTPPTTILDYYSYVGSASTEGYDMYAIKCADGASVATILSDGARRTYTCSRLFALTPIFGASSVSLIAGDQPTSGIWRVRRFVF